MPQDIVLLVLAALLGARADGVPCRAAGRGAVPAATRSAASEGLNRFSPPGRLALRTSRVAPAEDGSAGACDCMLVRQRAAQAADGSPRGGCVMAGKEPGSRSDLSALTGPGDATAAAYAFASTSRTATVDVGSKVTSSSPSRCRAAPSSPNSIPLRRNSGNEISPMQIRLPIGSISLGCQRAVGLCIGRVVLRAEPIGCRLSDS